MSLEAMESHGQLDMRLVVQTLLNLPHVEVATERLART